MFALLHSHDHVAWRRAGSGETLEPHPVSSMDTGETERDIRQESGVTGQGAMALSYGRVH